ncbi:MAG TPA: twin-arginine translocase TatA/TatE family subunit [Paracoccaceae bacterium]|nr:twin-arginine translocase TatA/TatE family subunit [Paracoccaceae bacterium]
MGLSLWHILVVVLLIVVLFGRGKISGIMGDLAKGINAFKKGMAEGNDEKKALDPAQGAIDVTPSATKEGPAKTNG